MYHHYTRSAEDAEIKTRIWQKCDPQARRGCCAPHSALTSGFGQHTSRALATSCVHDTACCVARDDTAHRSRQTDAYALLATAGSL